MRVLSTPCRAKSRRAAPVSLPRVALRRRAFRSGWGATLSAVITDDSINFRAIRSQSQRNSIAVMPESFLDLLDPADRALVLQGSNQVSFPAGFVSYGAPGSRPLALIVEAGLVRLFVQSEDGRQASVSYLQPQDIYAFDGVLPPGPAHIQALEDSRLLLLDPDNLFRLAVENLAVAEASIRILGDVVRHLERVITVRS